MAVDAKAIVTFGFLPTQSTEFFGRVMTFGWWDGVPPVPPIAGGGGATQITVTLIGKTRV